MRCSLAGSSSDSSLPAICLWRKGEGRRLGDVLGLDTKVRIRHLTPLLIDVMYITLHRHVRAVLLSVLLVMVPAENVRSQTVSEEILDEGKQKMIWDSEHVTFEIEFRFGKPFRDVLKSGDAKRLTKWFHKNFTGLALSPDAKQKRRQKSIVVELTRSAEADGSTVVADRDKLISELLAFAKKAKTIERTGLRVLNISGDEKSGWTTKLLLTVSGKDAKEQLIDLSSKHEVGFTLSDDGQFITGPCISSWKMKSERIMSSSGHLMEEVTQAAGLTRIPVSDNWRLPANSRPMQFRSQVAVEDFDRDGFLDIALASTRGATALFRSVGGKRFELVNELYGIQRMSARRGRSLATWLDFNNDGFPDLFLGDRVYQNKKGKRFVEVTTKTGIRFPQDPMGAAVADYDGDGFADIYLLYQFSAETGKRRDDLPWVGDEISGAPNALWRNLGDGRFEDVTAKAKASCGTRNSFAATWMYADADAFPDLYVANDFGKNNLLRNRGDGTFEDISQQSGVADFATSMGVASGDLNNDGTPEIYVANMYSKMGRRIIANVGEKDYSPGIYEQIKGACAGNRLYRREEKGNYSEWSEQWGINNIGWAYAPAMVDLDNDGLLDLHATTGFLSFDRGKPDG